jgi:hypothetical protein
LWRIALSISASPSDHLAVPEAAILVVQEHDTSLRIEPCSRARMLQEEEGGQTHDLGLSLKQPQQQPRQPDGLVA